jgi:hypothetical protein
MKIHPPTAELLNADILVQTDVPTHEAKVIVAFFNFLTMRNKKYFLLRVRF